MAGQSVLFQFGDDPFKNRYCDVDGRDAFTVLPTAPYPPHANTVVKLTRETAWEKLHPTTKGPSNAYFYFGPKDAPGYIVYGNNRDSMPMENYYKQKKEGGSRHFTAQSGKDYKWKVTTKRMELFDCRTSLAVWELTDPEEVYHARLTVKHAALPIVTEIITTLALNRMAQMLSWYKPPL